MQEISTVDPCDNLDRRDLHVSSLPLVDLRLLSRPELLSLSLCRDGGGGGGGIAPPIDRALFHESSGSRKQTFPRRGTAPPPDVATADPELVESRQIAALLHGLLQSHHPQAAGAGDGDEDGEGERVNVYAAEVRRRTEELKTEEELVRFMEGLVGEWGSRRKKRKVVDAREFGDRLPEGWKVVIGIKRRERRFSLNCKRFISPNGQQFMSYLEVSPFLLPYNQLQGDSLPSFNHIDENTNGNCKAIIERTAGATNQVSLGEDAPICYLATPVSSIPANFEKQLVLFTDENSAKAQLRNILECRKCKLTFGDKDSYLEHFKSFHKRKSKKGKVGKSISDGVIIKDGKFECQFCHKTFDEKRRYNSHVGVHVRDYDKNLELLPGNVIVQTGIEPSTLVLMPSAITEMNAAVETAVVRDAIPSVAKPASESNVHSPENNEDKEEKEQGISALETLADVSINERNKCCEMIDEKLENEKTNNAMNNEINHGDDVVMSLSSKVESVACESDSDKDCSPETPPDENNTSASEHRKDIDNDLCAVCVSQPTVGIDTCVASHEDDLSASGLFHENNKADSQQEKNIEIQLDILPQNEQNHVNDTCVASSNQYSSPSSKLDESNKSVYEENHVIDTCAPSCDKYFYLSSKLDENNKSGYEDGVGGGHPDVPANNEPTICDDTCMNEMIKSSNVLDSTLESFSVTLPYNEQNCMINTSVVDIFDGSMKENVFDEIAKLGNNIESDISSRRTASDTDLNVDPIQSRGEEKGLLSASTYTSSLLLPSPGCFPSIHMNVISDKGEEFSGVGQKLDFNELGLDEIGPSNFGFATGQDTGTLPQAPLVLGYSEELEHGVVPSVSFEWDAIPEMSSTPKMVNRHQITSLCVWCRSAFNHEGLDLEMQADSAGFMCPACKAKISGQLSLFGSGLSLNSSQL